jgi:two-component system cell cycle response regulator
MLVRVMTEPRDRRDITQKHSVKPDSGGAERRGVLTVLAGPEPGRIIPLGEGELTIGRSDESTVAIDDDSLSRRHVRLFRAHRRYFIDDLGSTNGTFVEGTRVTSPMPLEDGMRIQIGARVVMRFAMRDELEVEATRRIYEATVRDRLTGVFNRHFLDERLVSEMAYAKRHGTPLSVLFVDADHFKRVNDTHGHATGDEVLRQIAAVLTDIIRTEDVVARYGGEEFVVVVRGITSIGVLAVAERLRTGVEELQIMVQGARLPVTVSIGVATQCKEHDYAGAPELLAVADAALYRAKQSGRNRVFLA